MCTLCPSQCNVELTVRDERVMRVMARDHHEVDDGWLCDKGRFAFQAIHVDERITQPLVRDGGELRPVSWERALDAAAGLSRHGGRTGALVGGQATNEEGFLLARMFRDGLGSGHIDSRAGEPVPLDVTRALAAPPLQASVPDLEFAHTVLVLGCEPRDDAPILDLRIRKGVRRRGVQLVVATSRPSALDVNARQVIRYAPGGETEFLAGLEAALTGQSSEAVTDEIRTLSTQLRDGGEDVVILWGERIGAAALPVAAADRRSPGRGRSRAAPACSRSRPRPTAAACARSARCPTPGPDTPRFEMTRRPAGERSRWPRPWSTASSRRSTCTRPIRSATSPTAPCGSGRSTALGSWSPTPGCSPMACASTPT